MATSLRFFVPGKPATQGSKRHLGNGVMIETNKNLKSWRVDIRTACQQSAQSGKNAGWDTSKPMRVGLHFVFPRAKNHFKASGSLTSRAPLFPVGRLSGDIDKLSRAVLDAMTCIAFDDDAQVIELSAKKSYCLPSDTQGAWITVEMLTNDLPLIGCHEQGRNLTLPKHT